MSDAPQSPALESNPIEQPASGTKRQVVRAAVIVALIAGAAYGAYAWYGYETHGKYVQSTEDAYVKADAIAVSSKLGGYVRSISVVDNQDVQVGTPLVQIDPTDYSTRLAQATAQVDVARAGQAVAQASIGETEAAVGQAAAALASAQRELAYLNGEVTRYRPLVASGAEPKQTLDQLTSNRDKAAEQVHAQSAALAAARSKVTATKAQVGQSTAQIEAAAAQANAARNDLNTTRLIAPIAGKVGSSAVRLGQFVQPGQRLLTIVPTQSIYIEANFKETQIGLMRPGQPVTIEVDALPGVDFHGKVDSITPGTGANFSLIPPQNATGNFTKIVQRVPVRIKLDAGPESRRVLVPGLSVHVNVDTSSASGAIKAIRNEQEKAGAAR